MRCRIAGVLALLVLASALTSCGDDSSDDERLSPQEQASVASAQATVRDHCRIAARYAAGRRGPPTRRELARAQRAIDVLAALAMEKPRAPAAGGTAPRDVLVNVAEDLEGSNCSPPLLARVEQALAALPPPAPDGE
jgi:hypothetical protein